MLKEILEKNGVLASLQVQEVMEIPNSEKMVYEALIDVNGDITDPNNKIHCVAKGLEDAKSKLSEQYVIENGFDEDWLENHYKSNGWTYDISKGTDCDWYISIRNKEKLANICYFLRITNGKLLDSSNLKLVALLYAKGIKINLKGGEDYEISNI